MGATKRVGEMLVQMYTNGGPTRAACVRFGNVIGSRGSVIPLFQKQIANGGPITVTHADMMRFFMTIPEAVQLILCAGALANHAEVFVLDMGNPRNILDLANEMILLSGLEPGLDIEIAITGLRPGEKLKEELATPTEELLRTQIEKLFVITPRPLDERQLQEGIARLVDAAQRSEPLEIYEILYHMGLSFCTATEMPRVVAASG
jgi:FlaA1/EpsC-like NDP-sugar epimerase